jgi:NAD(P)-dependent dehydrogenase (short-subunit alcohol dehydrogenase family)
VCVGGPAPTFAFRQVNALLVADARRCAREFAAAHARLDYLVLTQGFGSMAGYTPTAEGIEQKLAIHYYGRVAFILELLPLLEATAAAGGDVRVLSVLSAGVHATYAGYKDDPDLERSFSIKNGADAAGFYNDAALDTLARAHPTVTFAHAAPGFVATAWGSQFNPVLRGLVRGLQAVFAKSPAACAAALGPTLTAPAWRGGFRLADQYGHPARTTPQHDEARATIWAHNQDVLGRLSSAAAPTPSGPS